MELAVRMVLFCLLLQGRVVLLNPSGPGVSDEIASALRRDDELIDLKVNGLRQKVTAHPEAAMTRMQYIRVLSKNGITTWGYAPSGKGTVWAAEILSRVCGCRRWRPYLICDDDLQLRMLLTCCE